MFDSRKVYRTADRTVIKSHGSKETLLRWSGKYLYHFVEKFIQNAQHHPRI